MAFNFKALNGGSELLEGRNNQKLEQMVGKIITICAIEKRTGSDSNYYIINYKENTSAFLFSSSVITDKFDKIAEAGAIEQLYTQKVEIIKCTSKNNRTYFDIEFK